MVIYIAADNGARITTTDSELVTPMAPLAPDHLQTEPNINISMLSLSQLLSTSSFIGGQLDLPSTSVALPITQTSTATIASIMTATSTPVVSSFREQAPTASISAGGTVLVDHTYNIIFVMTSMTYP